MVFHDKAYDRLHNLWKRWGISQEDAYYAIENGLLRACVWMPMRYVERGVIKDGKFIYEQHEYKEGFLEAGLSLNLRNAVAQRARLRSIS